MPWATSCGLTGYLSCTVTLQNLLLMVSNPHCMVDHMQSQQTLRDVHDGSVLSPMKWNARWVALLKSPDNRAGKGHLQPAQGLGSVHPIHPKR